ncbi:hypothetical protein [Pseudomonas sp.]|uniref:hypothetical protein n=1 Tax=Pseudomonas sp. TaxID=306 RepID=UPI003D09C0FE
MKSYPVITPIRAGKGKRFAPGEQIELDDKTAAPLLACKAIGPAVTSAEPKKERLNVAETVKLVEAAAALTDLETLAEGEDRKGVLEAIKKRGQELAQASNENKE